MIGTGFLSAKTLIMAASISGAAEDQARLSCAASSLIVLGRLNGIRLDPDAAAGLLPEQADGNSVEQLVDAATRIGLNVEIVRLRNLTLRRPCIVLLKGGQSEIGHFACVRPIDDFYCQVVDPWLGVEVAPWQRVRDNPNNPDLAIVVAEGSRFGQLLTVLIWLLLCLFGVDLLRRLLFVRQ